MTPGPTIASMLDLAVLAAYLLVVLVLGIVFRRRAGSSEEGFFVAGRRLPWWAAAISMAATSFSIDTPMGIAGLVASDGVAGVWFAWCFAIGGAGMLGYALLAELWRRSGVVTDAELVELRYSGRAAALLRLVKALYFGILVNALALAWVMKAARGLAAGLTDLSPDLVVAAVLALTLAYSASSGLWGVVASDVLQYGLILGAIALLAVRVVHRAGGMQALIGHLERTGGPSTAFVPTPDQPFFGTFLAYVLLLWWAHKNASAPGPAVQRLVSCVDERAARRSALGYTVGTFVFNYWPMIVVALGVAALYPGTDAEAGFVRLLAEELPAGARGLALAALVAAFMSTVDTHLNLGASYLVHDVIRRFVRPRARERELVLWARGSTAAILIVAVLLSARLESVAWAWALVASLTAGYGLVTLLRWFWWRINAWSEIVALVASGVATVVVRSLPDPPSFGLELALVVALSTPVWLAATFLGPAVDGEVLARFVARVRPWGWWSGHGGGARGLARRIGVWLSGTAALLAVNFALGSAIFGRERLALTLLVLTVVSGVLFRRLDAVPRADADTGAAGSRP